MMVQAALDQIITTVLIFLLILNIHPALPLTQQVFVIQIMNSIICISVIFKCLDFFKKRPHCFEDMYYS